MQQPVKLIFGLHRELRILPCVEESPEQEGTTFTEYNFDEHDGMRMAVVQATGHRTVPVVFDLRGEQPMFIGGFDETNRYLRKTS